MKKKYVFVAAIFMMMVAAGHDAVGQASNRFSFMNDAKSLEKVMALVDPPELIHAKVLRDFKRKFPQAAGEKWYSVQEGFLLAFNLDGKQHVVSYDRRGIWEYSISYGGEKNLPLDVRAMVKKAYYSYTINGIEEILVPNQTMYTVLLQDEYTWKKVMVSDGELRLMENFVRN